MIREIMEKRLHRSTSLNIASSLNKTSMPLIRAFSFGSTRYPMLLECEVKVYTILSHHHRSLLRKVINSRPLRRWENHKIVLSDETLFSSSPKGYMAHALFYNEIKEVATGTYVGLPYAVQITIPSSGAMILKFNNAYTRDQWFNSLIWKMTACRFNNIHKKKGDELKKELKNLVTFCLESPLTDHIVTQLPINKIFALLMDNDLSVELQKEVFLIISPLLNKSTLTLTACNSFRFLTKYPNGVEIDKIFLVSVQRTLKNNTDFGKLPYLRVFVQDYFCYIYKKYSDDGIEEFIKNIHTANKKCPHQRVLPNLVTVSLACVFLLYEDQNLLVEEKERLSSCFKLVFRNIIKYKDWLLQLGVLLQAVPFPKEALSDKTFKDIFVDIIEAFVKDERCEVHQLILPIREEKEGWIHHFSPGGVCCDDEGVFFSKLMSRLVLCCFKRKKVLMLVKNDARRLFSLLAIRGDKYCIEILIALLDINMIADEDEAVEIVSAVLTTHEGRTQYEVLCEKIEKFVQMKKAGGPKKLTLPAQSTDADLLHLLKSGSFGNVELLNLAFTQVTSKSAKYIIELPSLKYLNLWATPFDDQGLQIIVDHCKLLSLNLCETPVTDDGLRSLVCLTDLRCLNVNSTKISALTYYYLKEHLHLKSVDIRYTNASDN